MVATLFRLNEFALAQLTEGVQGFWLPTAVFFAVYDIWETRVLFDSVFRFQDDVFHHLLGTCAWLILAVLATTITPTQVWDRSDALLFASLKFVHQTLRVFSYVETWRWSPSERAKRGGKIRAPVYGTSWIIYLVPPILLGATDTPIEVAVSFWVVGFLLQRIVWSLLKWDLLSSNTWFRTRSIKINVPFKATRYGDWNMLQLGAIILGLMTVPMSAVGNYATLILAYIYIAALNLLSYSMSPELPEHHALRRGGIREFIWLELHSVSGLAFIGIGVGLRVHIFYPSLVVLDRNRHYTWLLMISALVGNLVMFGEEYCHGGQRLRFRVSTWVTFVKMAVSATYILVGFGFISSNSPHVFLVALGLAVISLVVLVIQVLNGAFKRLIWKNEKDKNMGHFWAVVIGAILLTRARRRLGTFPNPEEGDEEVVQVNQAPLEDVISVVAKLPSREESYGPDKGVSTSSFNVLQTASSVSAATSTMELGMDAYRKHRERRRSSYEQRAWQLSNKVKVELKQWKILLNDRVYNPPHVFNEGNKATKFRVQWSDLFFDVLFVGAVFRLGDLLLSGVGAGFSEISVHFAAALGGGNSSSFAVPTEPARSDAIFVFGSVFVAVWSMWQSKLAYSSKVGTSDVIHKIVDMAQGLAVFLCTVSITTPSRLEDPSTGDGYFVAGGLFCFQLSMVLLWVELYLTDGKNDTRAKGTAVRNIQRDASTLLPLICSFFSLAFQAPLSVTSLLWGLSWLFPFLMRVVRIKSVNESNAVRDLHRYVIHRLGDGALIMLGEGVLQIIRADTSLSVYSYLAVTLALLLMNPVRIAMFSMDCFVDPLKHAQLLALDVGLAAYFVRSLAAPALVALGVALKKMVAISSDQFDLNENRPFYWLLCGASTISLFGLIVTYELHRFAYHRNWRRGQFLFMCLLSLVFLCFPFIPAPSWVIVSLNLIVWLIASAMHFLMDDYFLLKEIRNRTKSLLDKHDSQRTMTAGLGTVRRLTRVKLTKKRPKAKDLHLLPNQKVVRSTMSPEALEGASLFKSDNVAFSHARKVQFVVDTQPHE